MLEKVVAVTASAGVLVLSGAGMAVADVDIATTDSEATVIEEEDQVSAGGFWAGVITHVSAPEVSTDRLNGTGTPDGAGTQEEGEAESPRTPREPTAEDVRDERQDTREDQGPPAEAEAHAPQPADTAPELAETGTGDTAIPLAAGAGLLIGGAVLYRRARVARR